MYEKLNITENTLRVLSLFTNDFNSEYYIREVEKLLKISPRTAQLILGELENKGVLVSKYKGKIKIYKINLSELTKRYFVFVEQYKLISFLESKLIIKEIIEKITPFIVGVGIIFGSYVKQLEKEDSDLDIFVIGRYNEKGIRNVSNLYGIEISVKSYPLRIFKKGIKKDILIKEVIKNHIVFKNGEEFVNLVLNDE